MNDNEIRMHILFDFYNASRNQTKIPVQQDNKTLKEISKKDYDFNLTYLVKKELLRGSMHYGHTGIENVALTGGITGDGLDVVERFVDAGIRNTIDAGYDVLKKSLSYSEQIMKLTAIWYADTGLLQKILELLTSLIG